MSSKVASVLWKCHLAFLIGCACSQALRVCRNVSDMSPSFVVLGFRKVFFPVNAFNCCSVPFHLLFETGSHTAHNSHELTVKPGNQRPAPPPPSGSKAFINIYCKPLDMCFSNTLESMRQDALLQIPQDSRVLLLIGRDVVHSCASQTL